jgi:hypothetical protein
MKRCISCGKAFPGEPERFWLCDSCEATGDELAKMLEKGIVLEYSDGTSEILKSEVDDESFT